MAGTFRYLNFVVICGQIVTMSCHGSEWTSAAGISLYANSEEEDTALAEFRLLTSPLAYREFMRSDGYLIRWLIESDFDVPQALDMFKKFIEWRQEENVDSVVFKAFPAFDEDLPQAWQGHDKDGRPVFIAPFGTYDVRKIGVGGAEEEYQLFMLRMYEMAEVHLHQLQTTTNLTKAAQLVAIYDMAGFSLKLGACYKCLAMLPRLATTYALHYPQLLYKAFFINSPKIMDLPFKIVTGLLPPRTRDAMKVYGYEKDEWLAALHEHIPIHELPAEYGGTQPKYQTASAKKAQLRFNAHLVAQAQEAVRRDLQTTPNLISKESGKDKDSPKRRHHHHHHPDQAQQPTEVSEPMMVLSDGSASSRRRFHWSLFTVIHFYCLMSVTT